MIKINCFWCQSEFYKYPSQVKDKNFCCKKCRIEWMSKNNTVELHKKGKFGDKKPHLTKYNLTENIMNTKEGWAVERKTKHRNNAIKRSNGLDKGRSYRKYYGRHLHRAVMEKKIGRPLRRDEIVHHIDSNILNNDESNLMIVTREEHARIHFNK